MRHQTPETESVKLLVEPQELLLDARHRLDEVEARQPISREEIGGRQPVAHAFTHRARRNDKWQEDRSEYDGDDDQRSASPSHKRSQKREETEIREVRDRQPF